MKKAESSSMKVMDFKKILYVLLLDAVLFACLFLLLHLTRPNEPIVLDYLTYDISTQDQPRQEALVQKMSWDGGTAVRIYLTDSAGSPRQASEVYFLKNVNPHDVSILVTDSNLKIVFHTQESSAENSLCMDWGSLRSQLH